jgi:hypothetical protein
MTGRETTRPGIKPGLVALGSLTLRSGGEERQGCHRRKRGNDDGVPDEEGSRDHGRKAGGIACRVT